MSGVILIIRDGWGYTEKKEGNAIFHADTPFDDYLLKNTDQVLLTCHGKAVGLPEGFQGSSEVGHMNMGAGRIVEQEVARIFREIKERTIFYSEVFKSLEEKLKTGANLHLFGLLQDEGVHSHQDHLFQIIHYIKGLFPELNIWIHAISDGRDTPPRSFKIFYNKLMDTIKNYQNVEIGTVWGRYYGMDRSRNWDLIKTAYRAMVYHEGRKTDNFLKAIESAYQHDVTPGGVPMFDEYLEPLISKEYRGMESGDVVINFNYRQDRAIQISKAFLSIDCPVYDPFSEQLNYYGLTRYYDEFKNYLISPIDQDISMKNLLGEIISKRNLSQLRISETQKFRHITSFFNGKKTKPFPLENRIEIDSKYDPSSFALYPQMNAEDVTKELLRHLRLGYDFIVVNYANCDMVGHTGDFDAAKKGAYYVDINVQKISREALKQGYRVIITADHGNSEEMIDVYGEPKTSHTINPVKLHLLSNDDEFVFNEDRGILSDIAPLVLRLMNQDIPIEMTSVKIEKALHISS